MARKPLVIRLLLLLAAVVFAHTAVGGTAEGSVRSILEQDEITLVDLYRLADLANPTLAAALSRVQANAGRVGQAGLYPNPVIAFEVEEISTAHPGNRKEKVSLVQPLIIGGRRGAAVAAARAEEEAATHSFRGARREVLQRIHALWIEQIYFREVDEALADHLGIANQTLDVARIRFDARAAPESQVTKALLEVYELEVAQQQLAQGRVNGQAELSSLLGGARIPIDRLVGALDPDGITPVELPPLTALDDHPALRSARLNIDAARASLREAEAARVPDLGLFVAYGRDRSGDKGFVEAGLSVPLPVFDRNQGRVAENQALVAQEHHHARIVYGELEVALVEAFQRCQSTRDHLDAVVSRIMPAAERGFAQAKQGYRVGHLPFLELIDAQRTLGDVRLRALKLRKDLIVAEAELTSLVGADPEITTGDRP